MSAHDFAWQTRIKESFPLHYKTLLGQDLKSQIAWFSSFDLLVEHGWMVKQFVNPISAGDSNFTELTWSKNLLVWRSQNKIGLLDWMRGTVTDVVQLDCRSICNIFLDNTGMTTVTGKLKLILK